MVGIYEFLRPSSFNHFLVHTVRLADYEQRVLHDIVNPGTGFLVYASNGHVRVGSVFIGYLFCGPYLVIILGLALERVVRRGARSWGIASVLIVGIALLFTQQRDSVLGGVLVVLAGLRRQIGRSLVARVRLTATLALLAVAAIPIAAVNGLLHRFVSSHASNQGHTNRVAEGFRVMLANPFGRGLSTGAGAGQSAASRGLVSSGSVFGPENQFLLIGTELGFVGLILYAASFVGIYRRLGLRSGDDTAGEAATTASGLRNASLGLLIPCFVSMPFINVALDFSLFGLLGAAVGSLERARTESPTQDEQRGTSRAVL
jgi:hypothetical protein